jgi:hypothetical protein
MVTFRKASVAARLCLHAQSSTALECDRNRINDCDVLTKSDASTGEEHWLNWLQDSSPVSMISKCMSGGTGLRARFMAHTVAADELVLGNTCPTLFDRAPSTRSRPAMGRPVRSCVQFGFGQNGLYATGLRRQAFASAQPRNGGVLPCVRESRDIFLAYGSV